MYTSLRESVNLQEISEICDSSKCEPDLASCTCNSSVREAEEGGSLRTQELRTSLDYIAKPGPKKVIGEGDWSGGLAVRNPYCFCKRTGVQNAAPSWGTLYASVTAVLGDPVPLASAASTPHAHIHTFS